MRPQDLKTYTKPRFARRVADLSCGALDAWSIHEQALERLARGEDIIALSIGDPDLDTPRPVTDAAIAALNAGKTHYSTATGEPELRAAAAAFQGELSNTSIRDDNICILPGAQSALFVAAMCVLEAGDEVIVIDPYYVTYDSVIKIAGASMVTVPLDASRDYAIDIDALARAITPRTRAVIVNFPNNPIGAVLSRIEAKALVRLADSHGIWIISDEVYAAITYERASASPAEFAGVDGRVIIANSLSKSHAMTGWRIGWVAGSPEFIHYASQVAASIMFGCNQFVQYGALAAVTSARSASHGLSNIFRRRRDLLVRELGKISKLKVICPPAGMFVMVDVSATGMSAERFAKDLLDATGVAVLPGTAFGSVAQNSVRVSLMAPRSGLAEAARRIAKWMASLPGA